LKTILHSAVIGMTAFALAMHGTSRARAAAPNSATVEVSVPDDAKVWFDGSPTAQTGPERRYESPALAPGKTYSYEIKAQWRGPDGKDVVRKQSVDVRANESSNVEFVPRTQLRASYYEPTPMYAPSYYPMQPAYNSGYDGGSRRLFGGYYRVGNVIINGRRWGDIGYRYSHGDLIRW
jgi:uncharacterized protein (TIGR03000 family)